MSDKQYILKRTTTEEYEYDNGRLHSMFDREYSNFRSEWMFARAEMGYAQLTEDEMWEMFLIDLFEKHDGSAYGDDLFSQVDCDHGIETLTRTEDD